MSREKAGNRTHEIGGEGIKQCKMFEELTKREKLPHKRGGGVDAKTEKKQDARDL